MSNKPLKNKPYSRDEFSKILEVQKKYIIKRAKVLVKLINTVAGVAGLKYYIDYYFSINANRFANHVEQLPLKLNDFAWTRANEITSDMLSNSKTLNSIDFLEHIYDPAMDSELQEKLKKAFQEISNKISNKNKLIESGLNKLTDKEKSVLL